MKSQRFLPEAQRTDLPSGPRRPFHELRVGDHFVSVDFPQEVHKVAEVKTKGHFTSVLYKGAAKRTNWGKDQEVIVIGCETIEGRGEGFQ